MKSILKKIAFIFLVILGFNSCSDFDEINENPNAFTSDEVSAKFFMTELQIQLYAPNRFPYWRAQLIHADRYAGHFTFGFSGSWWTDALGYDYNSGYTDAAYDWMSGYLGKLSGFINFVKEGGDLQNEKFYAIGLIMKGLYYQMYVDTTPKLSIQIILHQNMTNYPPFIKGRLLIWMRPWQLLEMLKYLEKGLNC